MQYLDIAAYFGVGVGGWGEGGFVSEIYLCGLINDEYNEEKTYSCFDEGVNQDM